MTHIRSIITAFCLIIIFTCLHTPILQCMDKNELVQKKARTKTQLHDAHSNILVHALPKDLWGIVFDYIPEQEIALIHTVDIPNEDEHRHGPVRHICTAPNKPNRLVIGMDSGYVKVVDFSSDFLTHTTARLFDPFVPHKSFPQLKVLENGDIKVGFYYRQHYKVYTFNENGHTDTQQYPSESPAHSDLGSHIVDPFFESLEPKKLYDKKGTLIAIFDSDKKRTVVKRCDDERWAIGDMQGNVHIYGLQKNALKRMMLSQKAIEE